MTATARTRRSLAQRLPHRARISVAGYEIGFATDCAGALEYLLSIDHLVGIRPYSIEPSEWSEGAPVLHYRDREGYALSFDPAAQVFEADFPLTDGFPALFDEYERFHTLLLYPLRMLLELRRQQVGEYALHASGVVRDGHAIVLLGEAEAGKTTTALHLCEAHGFSIFANDQAVVSVRDGRPWVTHGQRSVNLRLSSASEYSLELARGVFRDSDPQAEADAWNVKRPVAPSDIGLRSQDDPTPLVLVVKIKLDRSATSCVTRTLSSPVGELLTGAVGRDAFFTKIGIYREMAQVIRGAEFTPMSETDLRPIELSAPDLDRSEFASRRARCLDVLFHSALVDVVSVRGPLVQCGAAIVSLFESRCGTAVPSTSSPK